MSHLQPEQLLAKVRTAIIGRDAVIPGPFGPRPLVYADYTASGRSLDFVEAAMRLLVLPHYANTHTENSFTGLQTTRFREGARAAIRDAVGADARHAVIFAGSGATGAIHKLASILGLQGRVATPAKAPVVFVGPYEHHSNELVWRESRARVVRIPLDASGHICAATLEAQLLLHANSDLKIGSFSAASNVTGVRTDLRRLAHLLHAHGAWCFADYAAAGPYVAIDMAATAAGDDQLDAIFVSPHKFVGGPGASGVLVADRRLFANAVPSVPGGGTVAYVTAAHQRYVEDIEHREEAGTPAILGDIRAGLAFALKADIGAANIESIEASLVARALAAWRDTPAVELLGPPDADRLAILSFNIKGGPGYLHPNFVVALLNDLFGIQARGGCSCAGPYAHDLFAISDARAQRFDELTASGYSVFRPGWVRLNLHFAMTPETVDYIIAAVGFVARRGAEFLPLYSCDPATARWTCRAGETTPAKFEALCAWDDPVAPAVADRNPLTRYLELAEQIADTAARPAAATPDAAMAQPERWFALATDFAA